MVPPTPTPSPTATPTPTSLGPWQIEVTTTASLKVFTFKYEGASNLHVHWGDTAENTYASGSGNATHTYATAAAFTVTFVSGTATKVSLGDEGGATPLRVTKILSPVPPSLGITNARRMFLGLTNCTSWAAGFFDEGSINCTEFYQVCRDMPSFNQNCGGWNMAKAVGMEQMFYACTAFTGAGIGSWNTANATGMGEMLYGCEAFNEPIGNWNVAKVTAMPRMLRGMITFDQDLSLWHPALVTDMNSIMGWGHTFNHQFTDGSTGLVTTFETALAYTTHYNQSLAHLDIHSCTNMVNMLTGTAFSQASYDPTLISWAAQAVQNNVSFSAGSAKYGAGSAAARLHLTGTHGWTITDGGAA
jgi:surface protein